MLAVPLIIKCGSYLFLKLLLDHNNSTYIFTIISDSMQKVVVSIVYMVNSESFKTLPVFHE